MKHLLALLLTVSPASASPAAPPDPPVLLALTGGQPDDPAHTLYREAYQLILQERWTEARKKFEKLLQRHKQSSYREDARYWSAYAMSHQNREKALAEYRRLLDEQPGGRYVDDALADMVRLETELRVRVPTGVRVFTWTGDSGAVWSMTPAPTAVREFEREIRKQGRYLGRLRAYPLLGVRVPSAAPSDRRPDDATTLRIEAVYTLGEGKKDRQSFETLRGLVQDMGQPRPLREAALDVLAGYSTADALPVLTDVARRDTNEEVRATAIGYIGRSADKEHSVTLLAEIFESLPAQRREPAATVLFTVADVGNDRAVDFLKRVALTHRDYTLRRDAVYYLGNIGSERARAALRDILTGR